MNGYPGDMHCREANMERQTTSADVANDIMAARRWLTLDQLLEVLPLKKRYIYSPKHMRQTPVTRIARRLLVDCDHIVARLENGRWKMLQTYKVKRENGH